tara:strand:+ start:3370 stop:3864 length:495 start_codon:yes stop_codon:yes gene_type:complete
MNQQLNKIEEEVYQPIGFKISNFKLEAESKEYDACHFQINGATILCRNAKITPTKIGQFVTFWKRSEDGPIAPFDEADSFDFYVVNVASDGKIGQFIFPKPILIKKGIVSTIKKEGKRAFRVYSTWDKPSSKQAISSQKWQLEYFFEINNGVDLNVVQRLYSAT